MQGEKENLLEYNPRLLATSKPAAKRLLKFMLASAF